MKTISKYLLIFITTMGLLLPSISFGQYGATPATGPGTAVPITTTATTTTTAGATVPTTKTALRTPVPKVHKVTVKKQKVKKSKKHHHHYCSKGSCPSCGF